MNNNIIIRQMVKDDALASAMIMSHAFGGKLPALSKYNTNEICDFMIAGGLFHEKSINDHYVATIDNKVIAIMHLDSYETQKNAVEAPANTSYLIKKYGFFRSIISGFSMLFLHHPVPKGELAVDFIAVHPDYRGCGIGSKLLEFGEKQARNTEGITSYTLGVIDKNPDARRLYERKGFKVVKSSTQYIARIFTRVKKYHKMVKKLT